MCNTGNLQLVSKADADFEKIISAYFNATNAVYKKAIDKSVNTIARELLKLDESATQQQVIDVVIFNLFRTWDKNFKTPLKPVVRKHVVKSYTFFRKDKSAFDKKSQRSESNVLMLAEEGDIPEAIFAGIDFDVMDYYELSDNLYLSKFITDEDTRKKINQFIIDNYANGTTPIGNNRAAFETFKKKFAGVLNGEDWKIRRVVDTTVNRLRNSASISYMDQAGVTEYEILGIGDNRQSAFCRSISGRRFSVTNAIDNINNLSNSDPANVAVMSPFGVSLINPKDIAGTSSAALEELGIGIPPYHGHCRTTIIAVL